MSKWLFDHDPLTGETQHFIAEDGDDHFTIQTTQDVSAIIEANKQHALQFNSVRDPYGDKIGASARVASIPTSVYYDLLKRYGHMRQNPGPWKRWLNDPDNAAFRTRPGTV
jgi:hypothetical protein